MHPARLPLIAVWSSLVTGCAMHALASSAHAQTAPIKPTPVFPLPPQAQLQQQLQQQSQQAPPPPQSPPQQSQPQQQQFQSNGEWEKLPRMQLERQYAGPLRDTVIQRLRDPVDGTTCYIYLPVTAPHSPVQSSGFVQYGGNIIGSINCIAPQADRVSAPVGQRAPAPAAARTATRPAPEPAATPADRKP